MRLRIFAVGMVALLYVRTSARLKPDGLCRRRDFPWGNARPSTLQFLYEDVAGMRRRRDAAKYLSSLLFFLLFFFVRHNRQTGSSQDDHLKSERNTATRTEREFFHLYVLPSALLRNYMLQSSSAIPQSVLAND